MSLRTYYLDKYWQRYGQNNKNDTENSSVSEYFYNFTKSQRKLMIFLF